MRHRAPRPELEIRLLGGLRLVRCGCEVDLPRSKRARALLGYLIATGVPHSRERLCDLLWDGPDDPRGALRWSLAKLRPLVDDGDGPRLVAERDRVGFHPLGAIIDLSEIQRHLEPGVGAANRDALERARELLEQEFLDGLDLPACPRFHHWCMAERERLGVTRVAVLSALIERLRSQPEQSLIHARQLAAVDPLNESGHAAVVSILGVLGRWREAQEYAARSREMLLKEFCAPLAGQIDSALLALRRSAMQVVEPVRAPKSQLSTEPEPARVPVLVERPAARQTISMALDSLLGDRPQPPLLVLGEPGIGKTRLLQDLGTHALVSGCRVLSGRAFEAERARPYGPWIDALRSAPPDTPAEIAQATDALLGPQPDIDTPDAGARSRLFENTSRWLLESTVERPTVLLLDDVQWLDEASASLLHHVVRATANCGRLWLVLAARSGELDENRTMSVVHGSLAREGHLRELLLERLDLPQTVALLAAVGNGIDVQAVFKISKGNPLFALELARSRLSGDTAPEASLEALIAGELVRLAEPMRDVVEVAAAFGRDVPSELLEVASGEPQPRFSHTLEALERRGVLCVTARGQYDFGHDLVRSAAYRLQSQARRRLLHRRIARALERLVRIDGSLQGDLAHHALAGGDLLTAARAGMRAADRCLRLFANADAAALARCGLDAVERLPASDERIGLCIALLRSLAMATMQPGQAIASRLAERLRDAIDEARSAGLHTAAVDGLYMLSWLHQMAGDTAGTRAATLDAAQASRAGDAFTRCSQLANTARCLLEVESDRTRAENLLAEAQAIAVELQRSFTELHWALALLHRWEGRWNDALASVTRALEHARRHEEHWREYQCLACRGVIELESGGTAQAEATAIELTDVARRMGESTAPFASGLEAAARLLSAPPDTDAAHDAEVKLATALERLREVDDKAHLAFLLNRLADFDLRRGHSEEALAIANEAILAARAVHRRCEEAIAACNCVQAEADVGRQGPGHVRLRTLIAELGDGACSQLDVRARAAIARVAPLLDRIPTPITTA
ncbi:MAG TPA: AAA family ATPase [Burkholderiaceae bacterium]|nr:AAA family ATPase [Burkholderiaceae bacterium]